MNQAGEHPQLPLGLALRDSARFDSFFAGGNLELVTLLQAVALGKGESTVFIAGQPGRGKSHLLQAVCQAAGQQGLTCAYLPLRDLQGMTAEILESERLTSEKGGLTLEDTDLHKLVNNLVATYGDPPPGIVVHADGSVSAHVDPDRTRTLLRNVIDNALKYSSDQSRPVEVRLKKSNEEVVITVEDFGEGIPERDLALVFEPFYRVDKSRGRKTGGYGLGLNLCRKIMEAHGGTIHVQSRVGEGTRFTMRFPNR